MSDREFLAACRILDGEGLTNAFGHLSVRGPDGVRISSSAGPGLVRDASGILDAEGGDPAVPGETAIHLGVYRARADVAAVCRFHGPACLAWGALRRPLPVVIGMGQLLGGETPVFDTQSTVRTPEAADALAAVLGDGAAVLLRGFGAVTVGNSVAVAVGRAWLLERNAAAALAASAAGVPQPFDPAPIPAPAAGQLARLFHYLTERHPA